MTNCVFIFTNYNINAILVLIVKELIMITTHYDIKSQQIIT